MISRTPNPNEWGAIQRGGEPIIINNPSGNIFEVLQPDTVGDRAIVVTPREQLLGTKILHFAAPEGEDLLVPAALMWEHHGLPCERRSDKPYTRLRPDQVDDYVKARLDEGWTKWTLLPGREKPRLEPLTLPPDLAR